MSAVTPKTSGSGAIWSSLGGNLQIITNSAFYCIAGVGSSVQHSGQNPTCPQVSFKQLSKRLSWVYTGAIAKPACQRDGAGKKADGRSRRVIEEESVSSGDDESSTSLDKGSYFKGIMDESYLE